jgi:hypothetical protein
MLKLQRKHFEPSKFEERFQILTPKVVSERRFEPFQPFELVDQRSTVTFS